MARTRRRLLLFWCGFCLSPNVKNAASRRSPYLRFLISGMVSGRSLRANTRARSQSIIKRSEQFRAATLYRMRATVRLSWRINIFSMPAPSSQRGIARCCICRPSDLIAACELGKHSIRAKLAFRSMQSERSIQQRRNSRQRSCHAPIFPPRKSCSRFATIPRRDQGKHRPIGSRQALRTLSYVTTTMSTNVSTVLSQQLEPFSAC